MNKNYKFIFNPLILGTYIILRNSINIYFHNRIKNKYYPVFPKIINYEENIKDRCSMCKKEYMSRICYPCWMESYIKIN